MGERGRARAVARFSTGARTARVVDRWNAILCDRARATKPRPLRGFAEAFGGDASPTVGARTIAVREALAAATSGVALVRLGQDDAVARRSAASQRRASFAKIVKRGGVVRLRAMNAGASLLVEALSDCAALGHRPLVEMKLRRFAEPDFQTHALPLIRGVRLSHSVPSTGAAALLGRLSSLPGEAVALVRSLRLSFTREAELSSQLTASAVPEARALSAFFAERGVAVALSPDLLGWLAGPPADIFTEEDRDGDRDAR
jgi:hypothetical protein